MAKEIRIEEGKLKVIFEIRDNGVVELKQFDPAGRADVRERKREAEDFYPITEDGAAAGCMRISTMSAAEPQILPIRAMRSWKIKKEKNW